MAEPLWDPARRASVDPADAVIVVHDFLRRCRAWADEREIPKRLARVAEDQQPESAASLHAWLAYAQFTDHALREIEAGHLDHWFRAPDNS